MRGDPATSPPPEWLAGFRRAYPPLDAPPIDLVELYSACDEIDEGGQRLPVRVGHWCPHGAEYRVRSA